MSNEFFRSIKSSHEEPEVFFQIMFFYKMLEKTFITELFHRELQNVCFDIKEYLFPKTAFGGCFWNKWI